MLRGGVRPAWLAQCPQMLNLVAEVNGPDDVYATALLLESRLMKAISRLGDGPYGRATALLFGANEATRGLLLKSRRRLAADQFEILPSTFRKNYEGKIVEDLAVELWRDLGSAS